MRCTESSSQLKEVLRCLPARFPLAFLSFSDHLIPWHMGNRSSVYRGGQMDGQGECLGAII